MLFFGITFSTAPTASTENMFMHHRYYKVITVFVNPSFDDLLIYIHKISVYDEIPLQLLVQSIISTKL